MTQPFGEEFYLQTLRIHAGIRWAQGQIADKRNELIVLPMQDILISAQRKRRHWWWGMSHNLHWVDKKYGISIYPIWCDSNSATHWGVMSNGELAMFCSDPIEDGHGHPILVRDWRGNETAFSHHWIIRHLVEGDITAEEREIIDGALALQIAAA